MSLVDDHAFAIADINGVQHEMIGGAIENICAIVPIAGIGSGPAADLAHVREIKGQLHVVTQLTLSDFERI